MPLDLRLAVSDDPVGDYPIFIRCREHNDKRRGNLAVYRDNLNCYGCGFHISAWDEKKAGPTSQHPLAYLLGLSNAEALAQEAHYHSESLDAYREKTAQDARRDPLPGSLARLYNDVLLTGPRQARQAWLTRRGLTVATIHGNYLGHDGNRFVIPIFDADEHLMTLRYRRDDVYYCTCGAADPSETGQAHSETCGAATTSKYSGLKGRNGLYAYPENLIAAHQPDYLVLCEGELDALRLWQEGIPAVSATNGAGQARKILGYLKQHYPTVTYYLIATDMDEPGREAAALAAQTLTELGLRGEIAEWSNTDGQAKDITDAFNCGRLRADQLRPHCAA